MAYGFCLDPSLLSVKSDVSWSGLVLVLLFISGEGSNIYYCILLYGGCSGAAGCRRKLSNVRWAD